MSAIAREPVPRPPPDSRILAPRHEGGSGDEVPRLSRAGGWERCCAAQPRPNSVALFLAAADMQTHGERPTDALELLHHRQDRTRDHIGDEAATVDRLPVDG